jgi:hypothetical protein
MKKERIFAGLGLAALIIAVSFVLAGCENPAGDDGGYSIVTERYVTVPVSSLISAAQSAKLSRAVEDSDSYLLASSGIDEDNEIHYYLYYLGYVKSVPIAYKEAYRYNGTTSITITFEKNWVTEETITESTTKTKENTTSVNASATVTAGIEASAGVLFASVKTSLSASTTLGTEYLSTVSVSNTLETAKAKAEGETQSISATIGEHGEEPGTYRYSLFGVTDVYCLFAVDPESREVLSTEYTTCARASTYAWGIDFDPDEIPAFGKTGEGDLLEIPEIDFNTVDAPTDILEGMPEPPPPATVDDEVTINIGQIVGGATRAGGGDDDINSQSGRHTDWEFEVRSMNLINQRTDGTYDTLEISFLYTVKEGQSNWTELQVNKVHQVNFGSYKALELRTPTNEKRAGTINGEQHGWVSAGSWSNGLLNSLSLKIDDSGDDRNNIGFNPNLTIRFVKKNN